jgi:hypothetical protein
MLRAYIDDSNMNTLPVSVLGGWIGTSAEWIAFSECWKEALWMKPRLGYFKLSEAQNFTGEFGGWSQESRDERLRLLIKIIEQYKFLGVTCAWPLDDYHAVFGDIPDPGVKSPYFLAFYSIVTHIVGYYQQWGWTEKIDFVFDNQPGHIGTVTASWSRYLDEAPPEIRPLLPDFPVFVDDKVALPLQAADYGVGWSRQLAEDRFYDRANREAPWGKMEVDINVLGRYWTREEMEELRGTLNLSGVP